MNSRRIVIAGGSGFLGSAASRFFAAQHYEVVVLSRFRHEDHDGIRYMLWDGRTPADWTAVLEGALALINFSGRSIDCRFTPENRREILESRINSVEALFEAAGRCVVPPLVYIQASSIGYYGNTRSLCFEDSPQGTGFLAQVCARWEEAFLSRELPQTRKVLLRIGLVLDRNQGILRKLVPLARNFLGGTMGQGGQHMSWIHIEDFNRMLQFAIDQPTVEGVCLATGIHPVTNRVFMATLRRVLRRPWAPAIPGLLIRLGAILWMRTDPSLVLEGAGCVPKKILSKGFVFRYTRLMQALKHLTGR
jgi:uncharacterized protein (TIGR01777 family)